MSLNNNYWHIKIRAFLRCPPDRALISGERERAEKLMELTLGDDFIPDEVEDKVEIAHQNAYALDRPSFLSSCSVDFPHDLVLTHPLSGGEGWKINGNWNLGEAQKAVEEALKELSRKYGGDSQRLFLALWRLLPERIKKARQGNGGIGPFWDLIPADPCVPDHSVWDHASISSALVPTVSEGTPKAAFLIFTVASVQGFLSNARRTQDLWMGSFLLSFLMWEAIKVIAEKCGPDCIISPELREQPLVDLWLHEERQICEIPMPKIGDLMIANLPNIFTALLPYNEENEAESLIREAEGKMKGRWRKIAQGVKEAVESAVGDLAGDDTWERIWRRQIEEDDLLDQLGVFWVVYPWEETVKDTLKRYERFSSPPKGGESQRPEVACVKRLLEHIEENELVPGMAYPIFSSSASWVLTARKNLRDFRQIEEPGHKCSLCGTREALHTKMENVTKFWERLMKVEVRREKDKVKLRGRIRKGDRLCAVCLTKRLAWEHYFIPYFKGKEVPGAERWEAHVLFPSTASIATAKFKEEIIKHFKKLQKPLAAYIKEMKNLLRVIFPSSEDKIPIPSAPIPRLERLAGNNEIIRDFLRIDGEWLFEESFNGRAIEREYGLKEGSIEEKAVQDARKALEKLLREAKSEEIRKPRRYYALIAMDGDKMGDWVAGKKGPKFIDLIHPSIRQNFPSLGECEPRPLGPSLHKGISGALRNFSLYAVKHIVEDEHCGKLIYAGGDDVLAFLPLEELLPTMRELRWLFSGEKETGEFSKEAPGFMRFKEHLFMMMGENGPTISASAVIAHHTHPFSHVVEEAHEEALKKDAKDMQGRNAFAIHLLKRSGEPVRVGAKWSYGQLDILETLERIARWMQDGKLSSRLVYQMKEEASGLSTETSRQEGWRSLNELSEARLFELERLVSRHIKAKDREERKILKEKIGRELKRLLRGIEESINDQIEEIRSKAESEKERKGLEEQLWRLWDRVTDLLLVARFIAEEM